jgi:hypothetical protein
MNFFRCFLRIIFLTAGGLFLGAGCANFFVVKHKVMVDAISAPGAAKPSGQSYRLVAKRSVVSQVPVQLPVVAACVHAALSGQGMFEAPPNVPPDLFIEVGIGMDTTPRIDASARETYLQFSARTNPDRSLDRGIGPEVWDVRVAVFGISGRIESAMPLLAAVAATHVATDTHLETKVEVPANSPMISSVRETAIKVLDGAKTPAAGGSGTPTVPSAPAPGR